MPSQDGLLKSHGLNPDEVAYFRKVRDCLPPFDIAKVRRKLKRLQRLARSIDAKYDEIAALSQEFDDEVGAEVGGTPRNIGLAYYRNIINLEGPWAAEIPAIEYKPSAEEWGSRPNPENKQALDTWNMFVLALEQAPVRIYRTSPKNDNEWAAEFKRIDGSSMFVSSSELKTNHRTLDGEGIISAGSYSEIFKDVEEWLSKSHHEPPRV